MTTSHDPAAGKAEQSAVPGKLTLDDIRVTPKGIRRAYAVTRKCKTDPPSIPIEGPERDTLVTAAEIASMASTVLTDLSPASRPHTAEKISEGVDIQHHQLRCAVCKHRDRESIEDAFLRWQNVHWIVEDFNLPSRNSVYRHAHAFRLFARRKANLSFALEHLIEEAERVRPTASAVIDAVRVYAHIDENGRWIEPPTTHFVLPAAISSIAPSIGTRVQTEK